MSLASFQVEGQDQTPQELLVSNSRQVIQDVLQHIENNETCGNIIDYANYKIDWLISLIVRFGSSFNREERLLELLQGARHLLTQFLSVSYDRFCCFPEIVRYISLYSPLP